MNYYKCLVFAIELGDGSFTDLMPGLSISYVTYALLVGRTLTPTAGTAGYLYSTFQPTSITFNSYTQGVDHPTWGTFDGKFILNYFI